MTTPSRIVTPERRSDDVGDTALRPHFGGGAPLQPRPLR